MQPGRLRLRFFLLLLSVTLAPAAARPLHPVSHVDAWVTVDAASVDVRMIAFLDDVIRHQEPRVSTDGIISQEDFRAAVESHADWLRAHVQVIDQQGIPIDLQPVAMPDFDTLPAEIDAVSDAGIRLTWRYRAPLDSPVSALTFLPDLHHPTLAARPELRLHLRQLPGTRRVDATVFDRTPHTILLVPIDETDAVVEPSVVGTTDWNQTNCRLVKVGNRLLVEISAPFLLIADSFLNADTAGPVSSADIDVSWDHVTEVLTSTLKEGAVLRSSDGDQLNPEHVSIRFSRTADPTGRMQTPEDMKGTSPAVISVNARLEFDVDSDSPDGVFAWFGTPPLLDPVNVTWLSPFSSRSDVVRVEDEVLSIPLAFGAYSGPEAGKEFQVPVVERPWVETEDWPTVRGGWLLVLLLAGASLISTRGGFRRRSRVLAAVLMSGAGMIVLVLDSTPRRSADCIVAGQVMGELLSRVTAVASQPQNESTAEAILQVMSPRIAESLFLDLSEPMASADGDLAGVVLSLKTPGIEVLDCSVADPPQQRFSVRARWTIEGRVYHWGHIHDRQLLCSGSLQAVCRNGCWILDAFELTEANARAEFADSGDLDEASRRSP